MDIKQFELFQGAIQWVVDQHNRGTNTSVLEHDQGNWGEGILSPTPEWRKDTDGLAYAVVCPTAGCVAGNIVAMNGDQFVIGMAPEFVKANVHRKMEVQVQECWSADDGIHTIPGRARELAGLTPGEATRLFNGDNDVDDIVNIAHMIATNHGYQLELK